MARFLGIGNGKDGSVDFSSYTQTWYSCSGTAASYDVSVTGTFSPGDRVFIYQTTGTGVGSHEDATVDSYVAGTLTLVQPLENTYTDSGASQAQIAVVKEATSTSGTYSMSAYNGDVGGILVIAVSGTVGGIVDATAKGYRGGTGSTGVNVIGMQGENTTGSRTRSTSAANNGGGGGPANSVESGDNGGAGGSHATVGTAGTGSSAATTLIGQADLTTGIFMGGGGGSAGSRDTGSYNAGNAGRAGGGIIVIYANKITGTFTVNGGSESSSTGAEYPGGAGAGGTILTKSISNTGTYSAIGGTGGSRSGGGGTSGNGGVGRIRHEACSLSDSSTPTASSQVGGHSYCGGAAFIY